ncbi:MAG: hypothetical protein ABIS03_03365 [Gemmatimonadaceae bacterium]
MDQMVARERERGAPPLTDWESLSTSLRAEGLIKTSAGSRFGTRQWMQIAAGIALAVGGAVAGRASAGGSLIPVAQQTVAVNEPVPSPEATLASNSPVQFKSPEEAWDVLNRAGEEYQRASAFLSASNTETPLSAGPSQYRTRLVALDNVMTEIRGALKEAPEDPVINQYYLATVGAREATLRQLGTTLRPEGVSLSRF